MNDGICIYGQPTFAQLFAPIFADLSGLFWITGPGSFLLPLSWADQSEYDATADEFTSGLAAELDRAVVEVSEDKKQYGFFSNADLFPKFAEVVSEDWNAIFGLTVPVDPLAWLKRSYDTQARAAYILDSPIAVCFLSIDGGCWEFYARDTSLFDKLRQHLGSLEVGVDPCRLSESNGL